MSIYSQPFAAITSLFPSSQRPHEGTFVFDLVRSLADLGTRPLVVAPVSFISERRGCSWATDSQPTPSAFPRILRPRYITFSNQRILGSMSTFRLTVWSFTRAVQQAVRRTGLRPVCCYAHFLYPAGSAALALAERLGVPAVVALGESSLSDYVLHLGPRRVRHDLARLNGILSVSLANKQTCVTQFGVPESKVLVVPNAVDLDQFFPRDRRQSRHQLGLPFDRPIVAFVGHFNERKGPHRLLAALKGTPEVGAIFLGSGEQAPVGQQVLFAGRVPHGDVPTWLSAADLFVLPTLAEGCPNAVLEALACGVPVVSSDKPFNREILDESFACLTDPTSVPSIAAAIQTLLDDPDRREGMCHLGLERVRAFTSRDRARRVVEWLNDIVRRSHRD